MNLSGHRALLTGGTGFFGRSLLSRLRRSGGVGGGLAILSRSPETFRDRDPVLAGLAGVTMLRGDVRDFDFPPGEYDLVIHAAAPARTGLPPGEQRSIILDGTRRVLEFAKTRGVEKLLFVSSGAVYGSLDMKEGPVTEEHPCRPTGEYGIAKLEAERMCLDSGIDTVIARGFAFTGPYLARGIHFAIGNFIADALAKRRITISGDGSPVRSYLYADDLADWLLALLLRGEPGSVFNVGSDRGVTIRELAELVNRTLSSPAGVQILGGSGTGAGSFYLPSVERIRRALGAAVTVELDEAIRRSALPPDEEPVIKN